MNTSLKNKLLSSCKKIAAVSVRLHSKDHCSYQLIVTEYKAGSLDIIKRESHIETDKELKSLIPDKMPVLINIEGWGVLLKEAQFDEEGQLKGQIVPNIDDFTLYPYQQGQNGFVAIIRTETLNDIYTRLQSIIKDIVMLSVGPMHICSLIDLLSLEEDVYAGAYHLIIEGGFVKSVKTDLKDRMISYKYGEDIVSNVHLVLLALCSDFISARRGEDVISQALLQEYAYKKLMIFTGWFILGTLFIALFINYLFFDHYNKMFNQISGQYALNENILKQLKDAETELKGKQALVLKGGLEGQTNFAWYTDRIVELMPAKLILNQMAVHPDEGKIQKRKEISFRENTIVIIGETEEALAVHEWITKLEDENWVKDVDLVYYGQDEPNEPAMFNIEVLY